MLEESPGRCITLFYYYCWSLRTEPLPPKLLYTSLLFLNSVKITIDTKEDTPEDIRKVMVLLHNLVQGGGGAHNNTSTPADTTNLMSMFGDDSAPASETSGSAPNFGSFLNLVDKKRELSKKYLDEPKIEFY